MARRLVKRGDSRIPDHSVESRSLLWSLYWYKKLSDAPDEYQKYSLYAEQGRSFSSWVAKKLAICPHSVYIGYSSASLEAMQVEKNNGTLTVLDEIAPSHMESRIVAEERARFPGWEGENSTLPSLFLDRLEAEWDLADRIVVNSRWTQSALESQGVCRSKIYVVPLAYESQFCGRPKTLKPSEGLNVLWLGNLCLRKGLPYAIEAARRLSNSSVHFTFAGPSLIDFRKLKLPDNVKYVGAIPRQDLDALWNSHHLFILPTLSDGFAMTQLEAIAHGLPVITTANCGSVIEHGKSGVIIDARSTQALVDAILMYRDAQVCLAQSSIFALERAKDFSMKKVWELLRPVLSVL